MTPAELMSLMSSDTPLIENIVLTASSPDAGISARVADIGPAIFAEATLAEVPHYQKYFKPYRDLPVKVLEIGVGGYKVTDAGGESVRMRMNYFRRGVIDGLDIFAKTDIDESRLHTLQGDRGDAQFLDSIASEFGTFDIVIFDGSHISQHALTSFTALLHSCTSVASTS